MDRVLRVMGWFYSHRELLFPMMDTLARREIQERRPRVDSEDIEYMVRGSDSGK